MRPRILIVTSTGIPAARAFELRDATPDADIVTAADTRDAIDAQLSGIHALIGCPRFLFGRELLERAGPTLRWVHAQGAGCEEYCIPEITERDIALTNGRIIQGPSVADHALALLLALSRNLHYHFRGITSGLPRPVELRGKTAVVVGYGGIGLLIAERLHACGMEVLGVDAEYVPMVRALRAWYAPDRLHEVLALADAVLVSTPATPRSQWLFDRAAFAAMRPSACFINVSRGTLVDTDALVAALRDGQIAAAGLDVTDPEPLPEDHPLRAMPNVIITPHVAGPSDHNRDRSFQLITENIQRFIAGQPLLNRVDAVLGY